MLIQPYFSLVAGPASGLDYTTFAVTVQAPVVEEFAKSLGLLLLLLFAPRHFDGPVDGVVFAFTIAAGFAFTENILYFGRAIAESSDPGTDLAVVFFLRGVMSPFAHAIFTGTTGLIMGFAARRGHNGLSVLAFVVGLVPAMLLHSGWNSMGQNFLGQYILVQVPIFLLAVLVIVLLRVAERRLTRQRLKEYAAAGWFTAAEVDMLATTGGRRNALRWAKSDRAGRADEGLARRPPPGLPSPGNGSSAAGTCRRTNSTSSTSSPRSPPSGPPSLANDERTPPGMVRAGFWRGLEPYVLAA